MRDLTCATLAEDKVIRPEDLSEWPRLDRVHGSRLQINEDRPGDVIATLALGEVDLNAVQLIGAVISSGEDPVGVNTVLARDQLPKLQS